MINDPKIPKGGLKSDVERKDYNRKITESFEELWAKIQRAEAQVSSILGLSGILLGDGGEVRSAIPGQDYLTIERDPIFRQSAQYVIKKSDITKWNVAQETVPHLEWHTAYDYDIVGNRDGVNSVFILPESYKVGSLRVYLNGLRLQKHSDTTPYDYGELNNQIVFTIPPQNGDLILIDYIKQI